jgi:ParB-like chromosome segregation protein Spo0J
VLQWSIEKQLELKPDEIGEHYGRYRLHIPEAERTMAKSLERYGQLSPVVVCLRCGRYELIDGFKRLGAVRGLPQIDHLSARLMEADEPTLKAAIYGLNRAGGRTRELEEAWIIHALVREDGMSQVKVATAIACSIRPRLSCWPTSQLHSPTRLFLRGCGAIPNQIS